MLRNGLAIGGLSIFTLVIAIWFKGHDEFYLLQAMLTSFPYTIGNLDMVATKDLGDFFKTQGYVRNVTILEEWEIDEFRKLFDKYESNHPDGYGRFRTNANVYENSQHLKHLWILKLATHPNVIGTLKVC